MDKAIKGYKMNILNKPWIIYRSRIKNFNAVMYTKRSENLRNSLIVYIKFTFKNISIQESEDPFIFSEGPYLFRSKAFRLYLKFLSKIFKLDNFNRFD